jgi:hypothetical protein
MRICQPSIWNLNSNLQTTYKDFIFFNTHLGLMQVKHKQYLTFEKTIAIEEKISKKDEKKLARKCYIFIGLMKKIE